MRNIKAMIHMILPTLLFYITYKLLGILPAVILTVLINMVLLIIDFIKEKSVSNSQILGIVGGVLSALAIWGGGSEKWTFVPALIQNIVMAVFFIILTLKKKSILKFLLSDFQVKSLENIKDEKLLMVNMVWIIFFLLKIIAKILGIIMFDYDSLYWIVFLMGDPAFCIVVIISIVLIKNAKERQ